MFESIKIQYKMARMTVKNYVAKFGEDTSGEAPVKQLVMLFVIAILAGALLPVGIAGLKGANTTSWTTGEIATYGVVSIMIIIAVVLLVVRIATE